MHYSRMTTDELYARAGELRRFIQWVDNKKAAATEAQKEQRRNARVMLREVQKVINSRISQPRLF